MSDSGLWANSRLRLIVTAHCNIACWYCHNEGQPKSTEQLSTELFMQVVNVLQRGRVYLDAITLSGGEPLLHPELERFAHTLRRYTKRLTLVSNGLLMNRGRVAALKKAGVDKVRLGADSLFKSNSRPTPGHAPSQAVFAAIDLLRSYDLGCELNIVLSPYNSSELPDLLTFCQSNKISAKFFECISAPKTCGEYSAEMTGACRSNYDYFATLVSQVLGGPPLRNCRHYKQANQVYYGNGFSLRYCRHLCPYTLCYMTGTRIDPTGSVYTCMSAYGQYRIMPWHCPEETASVKRASTRNGCRRLVPLAL